MQAEQSPQRQAAAFHSTGLASLRAGDAAGACALLRQAIALDASVADYHVNLAVALKGLGSLAERITLYRKALELEPNDPITHANLAAVLTDAGAFRSAEAHARVALQLAPQSVDARINLAVSLAAQKRFAEAAVAYEAALDLQPELLPVLSSSLKKLGDALYAQGNMGEALSCFKQAVKGKPDSPGAYIDLGMALHSLGRYDEALVEFRIARDLDPLNMAIYGNIGTSLTYSAAHGPSEVKRSYAEFDRIAAKPLHDQRQHINDRNPDRPLRIGYVSPDFRKHVVAYFALPLLEGHHPDQVETWCYYNHRQQDDWTQRFQQAAHGWVNCVDMNDADLAERIRADRIDILVDLAGQTLDNRLTVFARKPAPIQVTWLGYVTTTGLSAIDYRLTHIDADPPGAEADYAETLVRLPSAMWCFRPLPGMPEVSPPPFLRKGHITFGSFNRFSKVSPRVLDCWAVIMAGVADSRLVLCVPEGTVRDEIIEFFAARGVESERITMFAKLPHAEFWALHSEVDIALDPFPFNGGTTTCETLWLGVPLISCAGGPGSFAPRFASRMGYAMLKAVGVPELAAATEDVYVRTALELAHDRARLAALRSGLRARMAASALMDEGGFVEAVETVYRQIWRTWLDSRE